MNLLLIHSHDTGRYIEPYGHAVPTPNLMRLAREGTTFRHAFCAAPTCSPSRASMLTGQSPHESGMLGLAHRGFRLHQPSRHLASVLQEAGYQTVLAGLQHVAPEEGVPELGYDRIREGNESAEQFACRFLSSKPQEPFFLDVGFTETHRIRRGFSSEEEREESAEAEQCLPPGPLPDNIAVRRDMADYKVSAARLDRKVGEVLRALEEAGLHERTLVVYTTDHGIAFPMMKCSLTDHGIGVALILAGPGVASGHVAEPMVSQIDLMPTLCEVLGVPVPGWVDGRSMVRLLQGSQEPVRDEHFAEVTFHAAFEPKRAVRTERWKYIRNFGTLGRPVLPNCDDSPTKDLLLEAGWAETEVPAEELYDLLLDPQERRNLVAEGGPVMEEMRGRLDAWMERTNDPLLQPTLPVPEGVVVNPTDGLSPNEPAVTWQSAE